MSDSERYDRVYRAVENSALISKRAIPHVALAIATMIEPTPERIAQRLYLSGSKGGKAAAEYAAPAISRAAQ